MNKHEESWLQGRTLHLLVCALLVASTLALFARTASHEFLNYDDDYVYENKFVRDGLRLKGLQWALTATVHGHWHPLAGITHA